jgi:hypothetical protein
MSIRRTIRVKCLRFLKRANSFNEKFFPSHGVSDTQNKGVKIFEKAVTVKDAEIYYHKWSDIIYVEVHDIYFILDGNNLEIINGKFTHYFNFNDKVREHLKRRIDYILDLRALEIREKIKTKNARTLDSILCDILEIKEKESK